MYDIFMGSAAVGTAKVSKEGLYYVFFCRCRLSGEVVCKVTVTCGARKADLGILVPEAGAFQLKTRVSVKQLGEGKLKFLVTPRHQKPDKLFVPVRAEEPFAYLSRLTDAYLDQKDGQIGVCFPMQD